jgi:hypothetical protein
MVELELIHRANKNLRKSDQFKYKALSTFRTKLIANQLPTRAKLHKRYPNLYDSDLCPRCHISIENIEHIFTCNYAINTINQKRKKFENFLQSTIPNNKTSHNDYSFIVTSRITGQTLLNLALGKFQPPFDKLQKKQENISNKALKILYKIWKQRSATATTSPSSGIKWKKTKSSKTNSPITIDTSTFQSIINTLESCNNLTNKKIFTPTIISSF